MTEETVRGPFRPTKVVVLSELTTRERELYYHLLAANNAKFFRDEQGRFVGNLRILAPHVRKVDGVLIKKGEASNYSLTFQERLTKLKNEGFIDVNVIASERLDFNAYPRFTALIANNGDTVRPRQRPFTWVMKIVEDLYDHRFSHEKNDIEREDESPNFDLMLLIFPVFVVRRIGTNVGLKTLVDQTCWDLLYNVNLYRKDNLELEVFGRFLQEFYDHDDLLFFLYVRSVIAKVLHISFKARWQKKFDGVNGTPKSLWISFREAAHVARIVFGQDNESLFVDFMRLITPQMVGEKTAAGDSRKIDITEYLHLSVVGYHQSQSQQNQNQEGRMLVPIPGQLTPAAPAPVPTGITYAQSQAAGPNDRLNEQDGQQQQYQEQGQGQGQQYYDYDRYAQGEYSDYDFAADQADYAHYAAAHLQQGQHPDSNGQYTASSHESYDDPYSAAELSEGVDLLSLASSPIGRNFPAGPQGSVRSAGGIGPIGGANSSHYLAHGDDIAFDQSLRYTEAETPLYGEGGAQELQMSHNGSHEDLEGLHPHQQGADAYGENDLDEELNPFEALQMQREGEFLGQLIEPLHQLPEEYAQYATNDLGDRLHQTVEIFLADKEIHDLDGLDACLSDFLALAELRADMESFRDEIVEYYLQDDVPQEEGGENGDADGDAEAEAEQKGTGAQ